MNMTPRVANPALNPQVVKVGDGVTEGVGSDRYASTITYVSPSGKTVRFTHDSVTMKEGHSYYGHQDYDYESNEEWTQPDVVFGTRTNARKAVWSEPKQAYVIVGSGGRVLRSGRHHYQDPSF